jgi:DNA sulfur modification protein DndD
MILTKMKLENYGLFSGVSEFELSPRVRYEKTRPIILFGGKNGAGKTTFLDAIRLLLYGRRSLGNRVSQKDYDEMLISRVHRNKHENTRADCARVGLEFEHVVSGEKHLFFAERSWMVSRQGKVTEYFSVFKDGEPLEDMGKEHLESFIADIVPERLSQLFFFDGEKIKGIAEDISSNAAIAEAIQSLLGLDAVLSLQTDLSVYRSRLLKKANPEAFERELANNRKQRKEIEAKLDGVTDQISEVDTAIDGLQCSIRSVEGELGERGGSFAGKRGDNIQKSETLKADVRASESGLRECLEGSLPFALCPGILDTLISQLEIEETSQEGLTAVKHIDRFRSKLEKALKTVGDTSERKIIKAIVKEETEDYRKQLLSSGTSKTVHGLSQRESHRISETLTSGVRAEVETAVRYVRQLESRSKALHAVARDLQKAPDEADVKELFEKLSQSNRELGALNEKKEKLEETLRKLENLLAAVDREGDRLADKVKVSGKEKVKLDQIRRLGPVLDAYKDRLTEVKINTLQVEVTDCFNRLARKSDFVRGIVVDPKTFSVSVQDGHGRSIPKEDLSSGEKQIFAIAMLWGLARTSGRPLPVVVDTPLGRLDSDHRANLINNYFPNAGHQVILLSTDTEVDQNLYQELSPSISHCYHLKYQHDEGKTNFKEEYFWRNRNSA